LRFSFPTADPVTEQEIEENQEMNYETGNELKKAPPILGNTTQSFLNISNISTLTGKKINQTNRKRNRKTGKPQTIVFNH
jgi:hypothetical protein